MTTVGREGELCHDRWERLGHGTDKWLNRQSIFTHQQNCWHFLPGKFSRSSWEISLKTMLWYSSLELVNSKNFHEDWKRASQQVREMWGASVIPIGYTVPSASWPFVGIVLACSILTLKTPLHLYVVVTCLWSQCSGGSEVGGLPAQGQPGLQGKTLSKTTTTFPSMEYMFPTSPTFPTFILKILKRFKSLWITYFSPVFLYPSFLASFG